MVAMQIDPILRDISQYLEEAFGNVSEESPEGDYYVLSVIVSGERRTLKVHRNLFIFADVVPGYLRNNDIAGQLERGNVEIAKPLHT